MSRQNGGRSSLRPLALQTQIRLSTDGRTVEQLSDNGAPR